MPPGASQGLVRWPRIAPSVPSARGRAEGPPATTGGLSSVCSTLASATAKVVDGARRSPPVGSGRCVAGGRALRFLRATGLPPRERQRTSTCSVRWLPPGGSAPGVRPCPANVSAPPTRQGSDQRWPGVWQTGVTAWPSGRPVLPHFGRRALGRDEVGCAWGASPWGLAGRAPGRGAGQHPET